jgi:1-acyl-sn-glycerol-3-phosphate acyltransferase
MNLINKIYLNVRAGIRFLKFVIIISIFFVKGIVISLVTTDSILKRKRLIMSGRRTSKSIVDTFGIELTCKNPIDENENALLIGNHIGFLDIVCLLAICDAVCITSLEMKNTPVLGQMSDLGGCAYVDRKNRMGIQNELKDIIEVLKQGFRVVLYAESVASNGEQVLPFKKTLMTSAGLANRPIRPFVFNFVKVNGGPVRYEHRDSVCWYGDQTFFPAIWRSMKLDSVACEIEFLPLIYPGQDEDRTVLANRVHAVISAKYRKFYPGMNSNPSYESESNLSPV